MACSFPTFSEITSAEILALVFPLTSIGRWNSAAITAENTSVLSIPGEAIQYYNDLANSKGFDYSVLSEGDCAKLRRSLLWYIVAKYKERDYMLGNCEDCCDDDELMCMAYDNACALMKDISADISADAIFCTVGCNDIEDIYGSQGFDKCSTSRGLGGGVAANPTSQATANGSNADLLNRANHTGTQPATTLTGLLANAIVAEGNVTQHQAALAILTSQISDLLEGTSNSEVLYNDSGLIASSQNLKINNPVPSSKVAIEIVGGDLQIQKSLSLEQNPSGLVPQGGKAKMFFQTPQNIVVKFGDNTDRKLQFQTPSYSVITGDVTHNHNNVGQVYLIDSVTDVTITLSLGNNSAEIRYFVIGAGSATFVQSDTNNPLTTKTVYATGEGCLVQCIPSGVGSTKDNRYIIYPAH